jgi:hypothetical protein
MITKGLTPGNGAKVFAIMKHPGAHHEKRCSVRAAARCNSIADEVADRGTARHGKQQRQPAVTAARA